MSTTPIETSLPRETGEEKSTVSCAICGELLPVVESEYGSTSPGACPVCWPKADKPAASQLEAQRAAVQTESAPTQRSDS